MRALFLHCTSCLTSADLVECLRRCGASLTCVAFSECAVKYAVCLKEACIDNAGENATAKELCMVVTQTGGNQELERQALEDL